MTDSVATHFNTSQNIIHDKL